MALASWMHTWSSKAPMVAELEKFEEVRREHFEHNFRQNERYWLSLRAIVDESLEENAKVLSFFELAVRAKEDFAANLVSTGPRIDLQWSMRQSAERASEGRPSAEGAPPGTPRGGSFEERLAA